METKQETAITKVPIETNGRGVVLKTIEDMFRFANVVQTSGLAPKSFTKPEQILIAVQAGAELGFTPMRSLQSLCVVNGAARLYGDAPLALVRQSGLMEYIKETVEGEGDDMVAICETKRHGDPEPKITNFSVTDAKLAGLWKKPGPWQNYPKRMLTYRARAFNLRDNFPDALSGASIAEEYEGVVIPDAAPTPVVPSREQRKQVVNVAVKGTAQVKEDLLNDYISAVVAAIEAEYGRILHPEDDAELIKSVVGVLSPDLMEIDAKQIQSRTDSINDYIRAEAVEDLINPEETDPLADMPIAPGREPSAADKLLDYNYTCGKCKHAFNDGDGTQCPKCLSKKVTDNRVVDNGKN